MSFLSDFIYYGSGSEAPEAFMTWSGISLLGAVSGKKIWTMHGRIRVDPRLYTCLVGTPGSGKSFSMEQAEKLYISVFPDLLVSESIQSREDLLNKMTAPQCEKTCDLADGTTMAWRPFYCIVDEMENFVSVGNNKNEGNKMVATLVGMHSRDSFGTGFKNDANKNQRILNPYLSLIACTVPEWMMSSMRASLFVGGLGRRLIIVSSRKERYVPNPHYPAGHTEVYARMVAHLQILEKHSGELKKTPDAQTWWNAWYMDLSRINRTDPILMQFHETQHIMVLKVACMLALSENPKAVELEQAHLEGAYVMLRRLEPEIIRLTSGIGRNELAGIGAQLLDFLDRMGGAAPEIEVKKQFRRYLQDREFLDVLNSYQNTKELYIAIDPTSTPTRAYYFLPYAYEKYLAKVSASLKATSSVLPSVAGVGPSLVL